MLNIINDKSPYYITFSMKNINAIINICKAEIVESKFDEMFTSIPLPLQSADNIINLSPELRKLKFTTKRMNLFVSQPGCYRPPHKDGAAMEFGINIPIEILDDKCSTNWYTDISLEHYHLHQSTQFHNGSPRPRREIINYNGNVTPAESMTLQSDECILFNVNQYHDWDNTQSTNQRIILTLRPLLSNRLTFEDAARILFSK